MPLRDHFHPPLSNTRLWDGLHGSWPAMIVIDLNQRLSVDFTAEPCVRLGPSDANSEKQDQYEVRVYNRENRVVAAVEIVSPANKNRPEHRTAFATKCAGLMQQGVSVSIVDLVTERGGNLYLDMLDLLGESDPSFTVDSESIYAATACRYRRDGEHWKLESWAHPLKVGNPLPTLPLWLASDLAVPLELEQTYQETCRVLRIKS